LVLFFAKMPEGRRSKNRAKLPIKIGSMSCNIQHSIEWLEGYPNTQKNGTKLVVHFFELFTHMNTKWASKKDFIIRIQNYQQACTANPALMGRIDHTCQLVALKSNNDFIFQSSFVFILVKSFKIVHFQLCNIL